MPLLFLLAEVFQDYEDLSNVIHQDLSNNGLVRRHKRAAEGYEFDIGKGIYRVGVDFEIYGKIISESRECDVISLQPVTSSVWDSSHLKRVIWLHSLHI